MHAGAILRGAWRTTLVLAVLAGVAGGLVLAGWSAVRRGATSIDRFEQSVGAADLTVATCGPIGTLRPRGGPVRGALHPVRRTRPDRRHPRRRRRRCRRHPPRCWYSGPKLPGRVGGGVWAMADDVFPTALGEPVVVAGRMFDPDAPDEVLVTEDIVATSGIRVGDTLTVRGYPHHPGRRPPADPEGEPIEVRVVGVVRFPTDLSPLRSPDDVEQVDANPFLTPRLVRALRAAPRRLLDGCVRPLQPRRRPDRRHQTPRSPDQDVLLTPAAAESDVGTVRDAVRYETSVVVAVTVAAALAAIVVVGLAIARQANDEHDDPLVLAAIGATRRQRASTSALRSIPVAIGAVVVAAGDRDRHVGVDADRAGPARRGRPRAAGRRRAARRRPPARRRRSSCSPSSSRRSAGGDRPAGPADRRSVRRRRWPGCSPRGHDGRRAGLSRGDRAEQAWHR